MKNRVKLVEGRKTALRHLEAQLVSGRKPAQPCYSEELIRQGWAPLTDADKKRIQKEIEILKSRV